MVFTANDLFIASTTKVVRVYQIQADMEFKTLGKGRGLKTILRLWPCQNPPLVIPYVLPVLPLIFMPLVSHKVERLWGRLPSRGTFKGNWPTYVFCLAKNQKTSSEATTSNIASSIWEGN
ncbi:hypothetical protein AVEN_186261-1 [Araneus ventricosus]|uniref:Uncharacterized protein n=1 Tax=Araneus ventricosus TaxID=182803 RepID=A0A4Y2W9K2_ARAVE|nr:hypothetical protein AVEN_186261-1 [Araneus ventricosus]